MFNYCCWVSVIIDDDNIDVINIIFTQYRLLHTATQQRRVVLLLHNLWTLEFPHSPSYLHKTFLKLNTHREALDAGVDYDIFYEWQWALFTFSLRFSVSSICLCKLIDSPRYYVFKLFSMDSFFLFFLLYSSRIEIVSLFSFSSASPSYEFNMLNRYEPISALMIKKNTYIWKAIFLSWERTS